VQSEAQRKPVVLCRRRLARDHPIRDRWPIRGAGARSGRSRGTGPKQRAEDAVRQRHRQDRLAEAHAELARRGAASRHRTSAQETLEPGKRLSCTFPVSYSAGRSGPADEFPDFPKVLRLGAAAAAATRDRQTARDLRPHQYLRDLRDMDCAQVQAALIRRRRWYSRPVSFGTGHAASRPCCVSPDDHYGCWCGTATCR